MYQPGPSSPFMRTFVIVGHKATTSPNFSLEDIPGTSGRLDILCRAATAAFVISHGIRKEVLVYLVLLGGDAPKTILLQGESLRHLNPDERTTAALLKKALAIPATENWAMSTSGITVRLGGLPELLQDLKEVDLVYLKEDGQDIKKMESISPAGRTAFILGDHLGMTEEEEELLAQAGARMASLGETSLHADHCIVILNWMLDTNIIQLPDMAA